jgi:hypothetical protein
MNRPYYTHIRSKFVALSNFGCTSLYGRFCTINYWQSGATLVNLKTWILPFSLSEVRGISKVVLARLTNDK